MRKKKPKLIIFDVDNTLLPWAEYFTTALFAALDHVSKIINVPTEQLEKECQSIFFDYGSVEYPFWCQQLPSVNKFYQGDIDKMLEQCCEPTRHKFNEAAYPYLKPYPGVLRTIKEINKQHPTIKLAALTDAPRYIALWKLNKVGLLHYFDAVYGLDDPVLPIDGGRVKVTQEILLKHIERWNHGFTGIERSLPDDYEKPGTKGIRTVLIDFDLEPELRERVLFIGDNLHKDISLGNKLGLKTGLAKYGNQRNENVQQNLIKICPRKFLHRNLEQELASEQLPVPDYVLNEFKDLLAIL